MLKFTSFIIYFCHFALAAGLLGLFAAIAYGWRNDSGHSGIDPFLAIYFFAPIFALGVLGLFLTKGRCLSPRAVVVIGLVGIAFSFFVTNLNILNQYETWIAAGMPERNPYATLLLVGFVVGGLGGSLVIAYLTQIGTKTDLDTGTNGG